MRLGILFTSEFNTNPNRNLRVSMLSMKKVPKSFQMSNKKYESSINFFSRYWLILIL